MRLFLGLPLSAEVLGELAAVSKRLRSNADRLRWTTPETWHITLQFLGETSRDAYDCIVPRLRELHLPSIPIHLEQLDIFDRAGVLFIGASVTPELLLAHQGVIAATSLCGFAAENRPFRPHVTLARSKGGPVSPELKRELQRRPHFAPFVAREFLLYESFLGSAGARHEVRERFQLAR